MATANHHAFTRRPSNPDRQPPLLLGWSLTITLLLALAGWAALIPALLQIHHLIRAGFGA